jgi:GntR family transcriptional repressor for pyruvate dehydrogenase complex
MEQRQPIRPPEILSASAQVARHLREMIVRGELSLGAKLPTEAELADSFGVSRATVREALKTLGAQNMIRTTRGAGGGSRVTAPTFGSMTEVLQSNLALLFDANDVTLSELLEARQTLEVPATRLAAERRTEEHVRRLEATLVNDSGALSSGDRFELHRDFHALILEASGNRLLTLATEPIFVVLRTRIARSRADGEFQAAITEDHHAIAGAVRDGDPERATREMERHLELLRGHYERIWRPSSREPRRRA